MPPADTVMAVTAPLAIVALAAAPDAVACAALFQQWTMARTARKERILFILNRKVLVDCRVRIKILGELWGCYPISFSAKA